MALNIVEAISYETVRQALKKHVHTVSAEAWGMPPACSEAWVAQREDGLEVYQTPYDSQVPMVCMDAQPVPLLRETRKPRPRHSP